jgi:hypothetical protein
MHAEKRKGALHEPPGEGTGHTDYRPGSPTRRLERFVVPVHGIKSVEAFQVLRLSLRRLRFSRREKHARQSRPPPALFSHSGFMLGLLVSRPSRFERSVRGAGC